MWSDFMNLWRTLYLNQYNNFFIYHELIVPYNIGLNIKEKKYISLLIDHYRNYTGNKLE